MTPGWMRGEEAGLRRRVSATPHPRHGGCGLFPCRTFNHLWSQGDHSSVYKLKKESKEKQPGSARAIPWSFIAETRPGRGRRTVQQRKPAPRLRPWGRVRTRRVCPGPPRTGGLTREEGQRRALGAYRSPRDPDAFTSFHPHAALPGGHDDLPSPAEKTEPQTGSRVGARRLQRRAPGEAATAPSGSASRLPTLHRLGPGSRNGDPKAERHHFKARGRRRPAETGTRGVTRDSRG